MNNQEQMPIIEPEDMLQKRPTLFMRYLTVSGLYLSFFTCLVALLLNWLIPAHVMVWMPDWLILFFSTFLLSLFLAVSALPMALLAWRRKE